MSTTNCENCARPTLTKRKRCGFCHHLVCGACVGKRWPGSSWCTSCVKTYTAVKPVTGEPRQQPTPLIKKAMHEHGLALVRAQINNVLTSATGEEWRERAMNAFQALRRLADAADTYMDHSDNFKLSSQRELEAALEEARKLIAEAT